MEPITLEFLRALQELADSHNSYGYIDFLPGLIDDFIEDFIAGKENVTQEISMLTEKVYNEHQLSIENEIKRKEEATLKLKEEHRKTMGCGETCDCAEKAKLVRYDIIGWK